MDIFPPAVDDPFEYGMISAANALSDVYAMGGIPKLAMNILCIPENFDSKYTLEILRGGYDRCNLAGATVCGGHTIRDTIPKYGLSVSGFVHPCKILSNASAKEGDVLILTKALGTGILCTAMKAGLLDDAAKKEAISSMAALNKTAAELMSDFPVNSCTDITGFGLVGHAFEMATGSDKTIFLESRDIPILSGALELAREGIVPAGAYANRDYTGCSVGEIDENSPAELARTDIMFDPQTSGGLLISIPEKEAMQLLSRLCDEIPHAAIVGYVEKYRDKPIFIK